MNIILQLTAMVIGSLIGITITLIALYALKVLVWFLKYRFSKTYVYKDKKFIARARLV